MSATSKTGRPDISVVISTHNRASSLEITLECLAAANRDGIVVDVVVVDNASRDNTEAVVQAFTEKLPVRYLYEATIGTSGKSHALNRALDAGNLGDLIVVLDDDMSPAMGWWQGVAAISKRWPDKDIFTGYTYIIWPTAVVPEWATKPRLQSWLFSAGHVPDADSELREGRWFLGGHFWFRSRVLDGGQRFKDIWVTEPDFQLDLVELGYRGMSGKDAVAGHRIQPPLLQKEVVLQRAKKTGINAAWLRLQPYRKNMKQARLLHEHPVLGRVFCLLNRWRWGLCYLISFLLPSDGSGFEHRLIAMERMATYGELLRAANQLDAYSLFRRVREKVVAPPSTTPQNSFS